jgi:hypothetical protein
MTALLALNSERCRLGRQGRGSDYNSGNTNKVRNAAGREISDRCGRGVRVEEELVLGELCKLRRCRGINDALRTFLEGFFKL